MRSTTKAAVKQSCWPEAWASLVSLYETLPFNFSSMTGIRYLRDIPHLKGNALGRLTSLQSDGALHNIRLATAKALEHESGMCYFFVATQCMTILTNPEHLKQVTKDQETFQRAPAMKFFEAFYGPVIFTKTEGFKPSRRIYEKYYAKRQRLDENHPVILKSIQAFIEEKSQSQDIQLMPFCSELVFRILLNTVYNFEQNKFDYLTKNLLPFMEKVNTETFSFKNISKFNMPPSLRNIVYNGEDNDPASIQEKIRKKMFELFFENNPELLQDENFARDLLEALNPGVDLNTITTENFKTVTLEVMLSFFAGLDPLMCSLTMIIKQLGHDKAWFTNLKLELTEKFKTPEDFTWKSINSISLLKNIINEVLRLYPPFPIITRGVTKNVTIDGVPFYPNDIVQCSLWSSDRSFNPNRNNQEHASKTPVFGAGNRACVAEKFARRLLMSITAYLVWKFDEWELTNNSFATTLEKGGTLKPENPTTITFLRSKEAEFRQRL